MIGKPGRWPPQCCKDLVHDLRRPWTCAKCGHKNSTPTASRDHAAGCTAPERAPFRCNDPDCDECGEGGSRSRDAHWAAWEKATGIKIGPPEKTL